MALMSTPVWVQPPNYLEAMGAGSRLGLAQRSQDFEEGQAADRLRLAYDSLAAKERMASETARARIAQQNAALALRGQQMDALNQYRQNMAQHAQAVLEESTRHAKAMESQAVAPKLHFGIRGEVLQATPGSDEVKELRPAYPLPKKLQGAALAEDETLKGEIADLNRQMATLSSSSHDLGDLRLRRDQLLDARKKLYAEPVSAAAQLSPATTLPSPAAATQSSTATPRDKAIRANALAIAYPSWTKEQILAKVIEEMGP